MDTQYENALVLQLHFLSRFVVSLCGCGLVHSSPYRPREHEEAVDWPAQEQARDEGADFRYRRHQGAQTGQAAIGMAGLVSFGFSSAARRS